jgi:hypothetical protein
MAGERRRPDTAGDPPIEVGVGWAVPVPRKCQPERGLQSRPELFGVILPGAKVSSVSVARVASTAKSVMKADLV